MAAIVAGDIKFLLSIKTGSAGYSLAQANPNESLGKYCATTELSTTLFDDVSGAENAASHTDYRCFFVYNSHGTNTYQTAKIWIESQGAGGSTISFAIDDVAASTKTSASAQAAEITNETTAPTGIGSWSTAATEGTAVSLGNIPAGYVKAVWVKRVTNNVAAAADNVVFRVTGDTAA